MSRKTSACITPAARGKTRTLPRCSITTTRLDEAGASSNQSGRLNLRAGKAGARLIAGRVSALKAGNADKSELNKTKAFETFKEQHRGNRQFMRRTNARLL